MAFERLVGHERAKSLLQGALTSASVHTGYLFAGPPGVGKRLAATEFVRAWLCLEAPGEGCGGCESCRRAGGPTHPDSAVVAPEDAKKTIGIEVVREFEAWLAQSPALGRRKAAIVDPADALTPPAANALLKTLEEPPPGRVIVLVATRAGALPPTVRSRCQQVSFGALSDEEVAEVLRRNGWPAQSARQQAALAEGSPGGVLGQGGKGWLEAQAAVREVLEAVGRGDRGAALAYAEGVGEARERALLSLRAVAGAARLAGRRRLGDRGVDPGAVPDLFAALGTGELVELLEGALETHRRLEGDRPPNAKLALTTLLLGLAGPAPRTAAVVQGAAGAAAEGRR